ncbi:MAG: TonB-dependent receptor [Alistipes sp.]|nr:TonB-dependent receptor [Alistipes sp.]MBR6632402.1 TonB-dependent receptor [Alistipes sp.]
MKKSIFLLLALIVLMPSVALAQRTITGKVVDADNNSPLIGASLYWKNTTAGTTTTTDGSFSIRRVNGFETLVVDYLGYDIAEIEVGKEENSLNIRLKPSAVDIDEVVVEGQQRGNYAKSGGITRQEQISFAGLCKMACCSLAESFENSASVTVGYSDAISGARQIKMLGLAGTYTQILDENRPIMQGAGAAYGLSYTPGMWLNSIQVSKGVASVTAGHEAITGQINLEHRKPTDDERFFLNLYFDSELRPEINVSSAIPLLPDKSLSTVIMAHGSLDTAQHDMNGDGFSDMPKANQINVANKWLWQNADGIQLRWGWKVVNENRLGGQLGYKKDMYEDMVADPFTSLYGSKIHNRNINAYAKLGIPVGYERTFTGDPADAVQNNVAMILDYDNYLTDSYFGLNKVDVVENALRYNITYAHYFTQRSSLNAGASAYMRMMDNNYQQPAIAGGAPAEAWSFIGKSTLVEPGLFAEYTYQIEDKFSLVVGLRGDYSMIEGDYYNDAKGKLLVTPRSHIRWSITPRTTLRASAGMGYRRQNLVTDNIWMMTTSRHIKFAGLEDDMEAAATFGGSLSQTFRLAQDDMATISFDYFRTQFFNTMVFDQETADNSILIYNSDGKSFTDNYQIDFNWTPFRGFDLFATFRYTNAKMTVERDGEQILVERPLTSRYKGLINIQYAVRRWVFDATAQLNGPVRLPELDGDLVKATENPNLSPIYPMFFAQVSYKISNLTLYLGCENIANYVQGHKGHGQAPILGSEAPFKEGFNSSAVWGPLMGRKFYIGLRLNLY